MTEGDTGLLPFLTTPSNLERPRKALASSTTQQMAKNFVLLKIALKRSPFLTTLRICFRIAYL